MWGLFLHTCAVLLLLLYVPGTLVLRSLRTTPIVSVICAPLVSISCFVSLSLILSTLGMFCSWATVALPVCIAAIVIRFISWHFDQDKATKTMLVHLPHELEENHRTMHDWLCLALYIGVALVVACNVFLGSLDGADSFLQGYDNVYHLGATMGFVKSGNWALVGSPLYATKQGIALNPLPGDCLYPPTWNDILALLVGMLSVSAPLATNATLFVLIGVLFPANMFLLFSLLFRKISHAVPFGALTSAAFTAFPWGMLMFGPLYPNVLAFCLLPPVVFCCIGFFDKGISRRKRIAIGIVLLFGILASGLSQPNSLFALLVFLTPYFAYRAARRAGSFSGFAAKRMALQIFFAGLVIFAVGIFWALAYRMPFMKGVVTFTWASAEALDQAILDVVFLSFRAVDPQIVLTLVVGVGIVYTLIHREYLWLTCSFCIMALFYLVDVTETTAFKYYLTGFWYTDGFRISALSALFAMPLATLGLWWMIHLLVKGLAAGTHRDATFFAVPVAGIACCLFAIANFYCSYTILDRGTGDSAFGAVKSFLTWSNDPRTYQVYNEGERAFVERVKQIVPADCPIINVPDDGSAYAYGVSDLNVYYRYLRTYGVEGETKESVLIRNKLNEITTNPEVQEAVRTIGSVYVLQLDKRGMSDTRRYLFTYGKGENWQGIELIDSSTPGFETVLYSGDMRLYKITALDE